MRKSVFLPIVAVAGGIGGFLLRRWELASAFEPETGLPILNAPAFWALVGFSALVAAVLLVFCRGKHKSFEGGYDAAFAAKGNTVYITAMLLSSFFMLAAGILSFLALPGDYQTVLAATSMSTSPGNMSAILSMIPKVLLALLAVASFFCVLTLGRNSYRGEGKGKYSASLLMPGYMCALWLISAYQTRAGDPIRQDYAYELFAIIASLLAIYFISGFSFEKAKVFRTSFFALLAVYFCITTLADAHSLAYMLLYGALILYLTAQATALLYNDGPRMCPSPAVIETQIENETEEIPHEE